MLTDQPTLIFNLRDDEDKDAINAGVIADADVILLMILITWIVMMMFATMKMIKVGSRRGRALR